MIGAEALVVQFLVDNLTHLLVSEASLFLNVESQVTGLIVDLRKLKSFLEDAAKIPKPDSDLNDLVGRIRLETYKAEDAIDRYVVGAQKSRSLAKTMKYPLDVRSIAVEIKKVRTEVKKIYDDKLYGFDTLKPGDAAGSSSKEKIAPVVEEVNVVGFDEEANKVIERLIGGTNDLQVISIVGMGGLGKTTLAKKIYNDRRVENVFSKRAWSYAAQEFKRKDVLLEILSSGAASQVTSEMRNMTDGELLAEVKKNLQWKYLIVVDDVWTAADWEKLKVAFPDTKKGSRILLTSRNSEPALAANPNPDSPPHDLKFLTKAESWELLEKKVYGAQGICSSDLKPLGKKIAEQCKGLPLAIVVVAGMLRGKEEQTWKNVALDVNRYINIKEPEQLMEVLALSYNRLPHYLKACFLYIGVFPEDFEIPVWKLIELWIAEGLVDKFSTEVPLEDKAVEILGELIERNLVMLSKRSLLGEIKTCRIHDMLRDMCLTKAKEENFYWELEMPEDAATAIPKVSDTYRRLCIHSRILDFIASKPSGKLVRSFLCFNSLEENQELPKEHISHLIPQAFELLRVFDVQPIRFPIFPSKLKQLVLLRFLAISGKFKILPQAVSSLLNLQTLIVETEERTIDIQADIWKLTHLRYVHTSGASNLSGPPPPKTSIKNLLAKKSEASSTTSGANNKLQTLSFISPQSCTLDVLSRIPNIRKLGIRGKLSILVKGTSFNLAHLDKLKKLKLVNDVGPNLAPTAGKLPGLPGYYYMFPPHLKKLTLEDTFLDWKHISELEKLPELEVIKLKDNAFEGEEWIIECDSTGFLQLKVLHIGKTNLVKWEALNLHFPKIQRIIINKGCDSLQGIPLGLGEVHTLEKIELNYASATAKASARKMERQRKDQLDQPTSIDYKGPKCKRLQVDIYPPELNQSAAS